MPPVSAQRMYAAPQQQQVQQQPYFQQNMYQRTPYAPAQGNPYPRSQSLTQKSSISGFFKQKGYHSPFGKSKKGSSGGDDDDNEEGADIIEDPSASVITYNDIRKNANKGGDKYGYGGDTAPIIPTIVTTDKNTSNTDYRKYMTTQKKLAMNRMAKQGTPQTPSPPSKLQQYQQYQQMMPPNGSNPRAMSLQGFGSGSPFYQQSGTGNLPNNRLPNGQFMGDSRANSMMSAQNPMMRGPPQHAQPMYQQPNFSGTMTTPGPRNTSPNRVPMNNQRPGPMNSQQSFNGPTGNISADRAMSLQATSSRPMVNMSEQKPVSDDLPPNPYLSQNARPYTEPINTNIDDNVKRNDNENHITATSPLKNQLYVAPLSIPDDEEPTPGRSIAGSGKLNVLKLSKPQQEENMVKEIQVMKPSIEDHEEQQKSSNNEDWNDIKKGLTEDALSHENRTSLVEDGLGSLKLDDRTKLGQPQRQSVDTYSSTFSDSPSKKNNSNKVTGLYKLENMTDMDQYQTAQEFVDDTKLNSRANEIRVESGSSSVYDNPYGSTTSEKKIIDAEDERSKRRESLIKAKNILRNFSSEQRLSKRPTSETSVDSDYSAQDDTFTYKQKDNKASASGNLTSTPTKSAQTNLQNEAETVDFVFSDTHSKAYEPIYSKHDSSMSDHARLKEKTFVIKEEQLNLLKENETLMREVTLVSTELAESIQRETVLEQKIRSLASGQKSSDVENSDNDYEREQEEQLSIVEFETEMRKKSAKIVELIQQLNDERLKRFIAEEQILLQERGAKPSRPQLIYRIEQLNIQLEAKSQKLNDLQARLDKLEHNS
ncbi:Hypothetical protein J6897_03522 [Nakaseomyces glabratus]